MTAEQLRTAYLDFFKSKGHSVIPSASLIPENDPTVLFTTAGMHPLVPYLMGEKHPEGNKLTNVQKCIRTGDIEEVGDTTHHTFFEMLGNWSLGDPEKPDGIGAGYFKEEAIKMSWEFLTEVLKLDKDKIAVSVFAGDNDAPFDEIAFNTWEKLGIPEERIAKLPKKNNWWGPAGEIGPCGPDTEMFYWVGDANKIPTGFHDDNPEDSGWLEIWNDVFMEYNKTADGKFEPLKQKNVDTGMGLERTLAVINNIDDNYQTELFLPIIQKIEEVSEKKYSEYTKEMRIIADHIKAAAFIISDGIKPSNLGQGYVLRRLIRRAARYINLLEITDSKIYLDLISVIENIYKEQYPSLTKNTGNIIMAEIKQFNKTLEKGEKEFEKMSEDGKISGQEAFVLFATYGFPFELTQELAQEKGYSVDEIEFKAEMEQHSKLSKTASAGQFKGGLADASDETKKLHTTAHLMLEAMRQVLGDHVQQKGSNITPERLRFDFSHPDKLTDEQKEEIIKIVNEQIKADLPVAMEEMSVDEAKKLGATGVFDSKYGEKVKVYSVGDFSKEICGGPHVERTGELGEFKIKKEQSSSAGVRRIKAVLQ